jgi:hypothetical protein
MCVILAKPGQKAEFFLGRYGLHDIAAIKGLPCLGRLIGIMQTEQESP